MKVLSIRFCQVDEKAKEMARFFEQLGLQARDECSDSDSFSGAVFNAGDSWIELWQKAEQMPACTMLQIVVDDADEFAVHAKSNGLSPQGPMDDHGERIYFIEAPNGLQVSFQSKLT